LLVTEADGECYTEVGLPAHVDYVFVAKSDRPKSIKIIDLLN